MTKFIGTIVAVENGGAPVWQSPDGQRKIWKVTVSANGRTATCSTYSQQLATVGFQGEIEGYDKPNNRGGNDTFIKKPQGEGYSQYGGVTPTQAPTTQSRTGGFQPKDEAAIRAMWAIGQAVSYIEGDTEPDTAIEKTATFFFHMVDRVKASQAPEEENPRQYDTGAGTATEPDPAELNGLFGKTELVDSGDSPWPAS